MGKIVSGQILRNLIKDDEFYVNLVKRMLTFFSQRCQVDIHGQSEKVKQRAGHRIFILLEDACFACCLLGSLNILYHSYLYDFELYNFKKNYPTEAQLLLETNGLLNSTLTETRRLQEAWIGARRYGNPYINFSGWNEFGFLTSIIFSVYIKVILTLYFRHWVVFRSDLIETLMSSDGGQVSSQITRGELENLAYSPRSRKKSGGYQQLAHKMGANKWMPFNRRRDWLARSCKTFCFFSLGFSTVFGFIVFFLMFGAYEFKVFQNYRLKLEPLDLLAMVELTIVNIFSVTCSCFYFSSTALTSIDQIMSSQHISSAIEDCIAKNERMLATGTSKADAMNRQVLAIFLDYRVFVNQTKLSLPQQGPVAFLVTLFIFTGAPIVYLHAAFQPRDLLLLNAYVIVSVIGFLSFFWLPFLMVQSCCHKLYRLLYSLMAHIAYIQSNKDLYSHQLVDLLRKELSHPNKIVDQLTVKQFGMKLTAGRFITYMFWSGLVLVAANQERSASGNNGIILAFI